MQTAIRTRFAPSPTGYMHLGNIWVAFLNWLWTRQHGGAIVLRIEDIDRQRSHAEYIEGIKEDLAWELFVWDARPESPISSLSGNHGSVERSGGGLSLLLQSCPSPQHRLCAA